MLVHAENKELLFRPPCWCIVVTCQWCSVPSYIVCSQAHLWVMPASGKERVLKRSDQVGEVCWGRADCTCVPQTWACMQATSYMKPFLDLQCRTNKKGLQRRLVALVYLMMKKETLVNGISLAYHQILIPISKEYIWQSVKRKNWKIVWSAVETTDSFAYR